MKMLGNGSLSDAINEFETKFKSKSGLKWEDRGADPKNGKCKRRADRQCAQCTDYLQMHMWRRTTTRTLTTKMM